MSKELVVRIFGLDDMPGRLQRMNRVIFLFFGAMTFRFRHMPGQFTCKNGVMDFLRGNDVPFQARTCRGNLSV